MGIIDQFNNLGNSLSNASDDLASGADEFGKMVVPQSIQNLTQEHDQISAKLTELEKGFNGQINDFARNNLINELMHLRILLQNHFDHLRDGGTPDPSPTYKTHPVYRQALSGYPELEQRISQLENTQAKCTFGFRGADGKISAPNINWTDAEFLNIKQQTSDQTAHCWKNSDPNQYL